MAEDEFEQEQGEDGGGLSTPQKVVAGAALGVAVPAAVSVARKLMGNGGDDDGNASNEPTSRERRSTQSRSRSSSSSSSRTKTKPKSKSKSATKSTSSSTSRTTNRTREQLYKQATRLKIEGRSGMNKQQLERAIARKKAK